jgi:hypothetical protein
MGIHSEVVDQPPTTMKSNSALFSMVLPMMEICVSMQGEVSRELDKGLLSVAVWECCGASSDDVQ